MGKFSNALDRSGHQNGAEPDATNNATNTTTNSPPQPPKIEQTPGPSSPPQTNKRAQTNKPTQSRLSSTGNWDKRLFKAVNEDLAVPEVFKILRSRILHPLDSSTSVKTIMVTSAVPREGKSFVTANLGVSLAQGMDQHALLVDCDLRRPSLAGMFGMSGKVGLVDYLRDHLDLSELIGKTVVEKLSILPSGIPPTNPAELLSSSRMCALVEELSRRYDDRIIIFDSPPMLVAAETSVLAGQVDGVILVVRQGVSRKAEIQKLIDTFGSEKIIGIVFNDHTGSVFEPSYAKGYGYYHQSETQEPQTTLQ